MSNKKQYVSGNTLYADRKCLTIRQKKATINVGEEKQISTANKNEPIKKKDQQRRLLYSIAG